MSNAERPSPNGDARDHDRKAWFEERFARHAALVRAIVWNRSGRVRDTNLVEELAAETWVRAYRSVSAPGFDFERDFGPWVGAIAVNVCREHTRRNIRRPAADGLPEDDLLADPTDVQEAREQIEIHRALADCLTKLPDDERQVYELRFVEGLSGRQAAERLGLAESTFRERALPGLLSRLGRCLSLKGFQEIPKEFSAQTRRKGQQEG